MSTSIKTITTLLFLILLANKGHCIEISIIGPCSAQPVTHEIYPLKNFSESIGDLTFRFLTEKNIPFEGSPSGFSSINHSATGDDSIEFISEFQFRAYGWCYSLNNEIPDKLPNESFFKKTAQASNSLIWFYGYSTYDKDHWTDYCTPAYKIKDNPFCIIIKLQ